MEIRSSTDNLEDRREMLLQVQVKKAQVKWLLMILASWRRIVGSGLDVTISIVKLSACGNWQETVTHSHASKNTEPDSR